RRVPFLQIWRPPYRGRTLMLVAFQLLQTVGYYGFMHWLPTLLEAKGFAHNEVLDMQIAASLLAPVGPLLGLWTIERWQRKRQIVGLALALAAALVAFGLLQGAVALTLVAA